MVLSRIIGLYIVLGYILTFSAFFISDYKPWENKVSKNFESIDKVFPGVREIFTPLIGIIIQSTGAAGILLSLLSLYGSKISIKTLTVGLVLFISVVALPEVFNSKGNSDIEILNLLHLLGLAGGLLQGW